jgi:hypothetical protein
MNTTPNQENNTPPQCSGCSRILRQNEPTIHAPNCQTEEAMIQRANPPSAGRDLDAAAPKIQTVSSFGDERDVNNVMRHEYRVLNADEKKLMQDIKDDGAMLLVRINMPPPSRERSLARTKVEEAVMWAVKGLTG